MVRTKFPCNTCFKWIFTFTFNTFTYNQNLTSSSLVFHSPSFEVCSLLWLWKFIELRIMEVLLSISYNQMERLLYPPLDMASNVSYFRRENCVYSLTICNLGVNHQRLGERDYGWGQFHPPIRQLQFQINS